jgi:hypothetical protein
MHRFHGLLGKLLFTMAASSAFGEAAPDASAENKVRREGPLAGMSSAPGPHIEKIRALGDNQWLDLGSPTADPKWGKGRGRSWSAKMPYAPDLGGAFLAGQGIHGYINPAGRYDDLFFYDLNAHRWICLYPGLNTTTFVEDIKKGEIKVNDDGQLVDKDSQPVLYAYGGHSYQSHAYDTDLRKWVTSGDRSGLGGDQYSRAMAWEQEGRKLLAEQMKGKTDNMTGAPFYYNTLTGKFERYPLAAARRGSGVLYYLPTRKVLWEYVGGGVTLLGDTATRQWSDAGAKGPTPQGIDFGACYDSKRGRIYVGGGAYRGPYGKDEGYLYVYDVKSNTWSNRPNKQNAMAWPGANYCCVHYDTASDRVLCIFGWCMDKRGISVYNPENDSWEAPLELPEKIVSRWCVHGFYASEVNAHFIYTALDSDDRGTMWVYRYKSAAE